MVIYQFPHTQDKYKQQNFRNPDAILDDDPQCEEESHFFIPNDLLSKPTIGLRVTFCLLTLLLLLMSVLAFFVWAGLRFVDYLLAERNPTISSLREHYFSLYIFCLVSSLGCLLAQFSLMLGVNLITNYIRLHGLPRFGFVKKMFQFTCHDPK